MNSFFIPQVASWKVGFSEGWTDGDGRWFVVFLWGREGFGVDILRFLRRLMQEVKG